MIDARTQTYSNFNELRRTSADNLSSVTVLGKDQENDGFGGVFYWDDISTESDDNNNIIQKTGLITGRWKRLRIGQIINEIINFTNVTTLELDWNLERKEKYGQIPNLDLYLLTGGVYKKSDTQHIIDNPPPNTTKVTITFTNQSTGFLIIT